MANIAKPSDLNKIWADAGDVLTPSDTKIGTGWEVEIPPRQWFNWLDNRQDQAIAHINQHGIAVWDSATEYQTDISYTQGPTDGIVYKCVLTNTNQDPETDLTNTYWKPAFANAEDAISQAQADALYLKQASNGSDIPNIATFRTNISVYAKAETYTKTEVDNKTTLATQAEAEAGVLNTVLMTPLRTAQHFTNASKDIIATAWVNFNGEAANGTYSQSGTTITVTITGHGLSVGMVVSLDFTTGTAVDGSFTVVTTPDANTFTVTAGASLATSGNVTRQTYIRDSYNVSSITDNGTGQYTVNFAVAMNNSNFSIALGGKVNNDDSRETNNITSWGYSSLSFNITTNNDSAVVADRSIVNAIVLGGK